MFAAPLAAGEILDRAVLVETIVAACLFLCASIGVYFFNDLQDIDTDRKHPRKTLRPIANRDIPYRVANLSAFTLSITPLIISFFLSVSLVICLSCYIFINVLYSIKLKEIPYFELALVSSGFVFRAIAGGLASDISLSFWFISLVSCSSLFVVTGKRYAELSTYQTHNSRPVLRFYPLPMLRFLLWVSATLAIVTYSFWLSLSNETWESLHLIFSILSLIIFALTIFRYGYLLQRGRGEDPVRTLLNDYLLMILAFFWAASYSVVIYG